MTDERPFKRLRTEVTTSSTSSDINLPSSSDIHSFREKYAQAVPYKHAVVAGLLSDDLLENVVEESRTYGIRGEEGSLAGWGWEQKETDIYKIQQTPDLSSLVSEHLPDETLSSLPQLTRLKEALYSPDFRQFVRDITGCGPLSGKKTDGSVGLYTKGSHLLLHDDSITTRLVSYILYLPNSPAHAPSSSSSTLVPSANGRFLKGWDPAWGGSLELYPVESGEEVGMPGVKRLGKVDVKWGQIIFFEVQPGRSYHSVEEVIIGEGRQRLGVSGWFHRPIEGEEGYEPRDKQKLQQDLSSLAQITSAPTVPFTPYSSEAPPGLTSSHLSFLQTFLAPSYLTLPTLEKLSGQFAAASEIVLHNFLHPDLAARIKAETQAADKRDYTDPLVMPDQKTGEGDGWVIQGPTSKHRYMSLSAPTTSTPSLSTVLKELLPSEAFRAWLSVVSSLAPLGHRTEARRFRRGLDYTLAAGEGSASEARLDVWLGATWWADVEAGTDEEETLVENGGWDCYLAAPGEDEDPAVYQSGVKKNGKAEDGDEGKPATNGGSQPHDAVLDGSSSKATKVNGSSATNGNGAITNLKNDKGDKDGPKITYNGTELEFDPDQFSPSDFDSDSDNDEDDGPLLTQPVSFNKLLLVLRDPGVMRFVKYLSAGAEGSRWDVGGEWEVGQMEVDEDEEEEGNEEG